MNEDTPEKLKPYLQHGLDLSYKNKDKEATAECPWCGRANKLNVNIETGQFRCVVCDEGGNILLFLRKLWVSSTEATTKQEYEELANDRKLLSWETLGKWGLAKSSLNGNWLIPGFGTKDKLLNLYQYIDNGDRRLWLPTTGLGHQLFMALDGKKSKGTIYLCEGVPDACAWWEILSKAKVADGGEWVPTGNISRSLLADATVIGIPGCNVFFEKWASLFSGKNVILMAQNDHPHKNPKNGKLSPPASFSGMQRVYNILSQHEAPPADIQLLSWGEEGYNLELNSGYDVRDALTA